jgi:lysophospholipase L1-like esterase
VTSISEPVGCRLAQEAKRLPQRVKIGRLLLALGTGVSRYTFLVCIMGSIIMSSCLGSQASHINLKSGDRVLFFGDSITERGELEPNGYINVIGRALTSAHPRDRIALIGKGVGGNRLEDLLERVDRDVIAEKPDVVVIYIGINDLWCGETDPSLTTPAKAFKNQLAQLADGIHSNGAQIILCTPTVIGEAKLGTNQFDGALDAMSNDIRLIAKEKGYVFCDLRKGFTDYLKEHNPKDFDRGVLTIDRVHLNDAGNLLVAKLLLERFSENSSQLSKR